jgi:hypothetical protein
LSDIPVFTESVDQDARIRAVQDAQLLHHFREEASELPTPHTDKTKTKQSKDDDKGESRGRRAPYEPSDHCSPICTKRRELERKTRKEESEEQNEP